MKKLVMHINESKCISCGLCREACPFGVALTKIDPLNMDIKHRYQIDHERCHYCSGPGKAPCEVFCPVDECITPLEIEVDEKTA